MDAAGKESRLRGAATGLLLPGLVAGLFRGKVTGGFTQSLMLAFAILTLVGAAAILGRSARRQRRNDDHGRA